MTEAEWLGCSDPEEMFEHLEPTGLLTQRKLRLFEVVCCRRFTSRLPAPVLVNALDVAEQFADGLVTTAELSHIHEAARELEAESAMNEEGNSETDALHHGAKAVGDATSPNNSDYSSGILDVIDHAVNAVAYASPAYPKDNHEEAVALFQRVRASESRSLAAIICDIFGNPFRPVVLDLAWRTDTAVSLARGMYESRDFSAMPILADALQDARCDSTDILAHCRSAGPHVRGCWVVDLVLGREPQRG